MEDYGEMPWVAIPWSEKKRVTLSTTYNVDGVPCVVVLSKDGTVITRDGRTKVISDPQGEGFPWLPAPFAQALGFSFDSNSGGVDAAHFSKKYLGLYFSAHW